MKVLVKIIIDTRVDKLNNDLKSVRAQSEARAVKLVMEKGSSMADMVRSALVKADLDGQYQCIDVSYRDEDFDEDVYISPTSLIELETIYKVVVSRVTEATAIQKTTPKTSSNPAVAEDDLAHHADSFVRGVNSLLPSLMSVPSVKPVNLATEYYSNNKTGSNYYPTLDNYRGGRSSNWLEDRFPQTSSSYVDYLHQRAASNNIDQEYGYPSQEDMFGQHEYEGDRSNITSSGGMYRSHRGDASPSSYQQCYDRAYDGQPQMNDGVTALVSCIRQDPRSNHTYGQPSSTYFFGQTAYADPTQYYYGKKIKQKKKQSNGVDKANRQNSNGTTEPPKDDKEAAQQDSVSPSAKQDSIDDLQEEGGQGDKELEVQIESPEFEPPDESETQKESPKFEPLDESELQKETTEKAESVSEPQTQQQLQHKSQSKPIDKKKKRSYNNEGDMQIPSLFDLPSIRSSPRMVRPMPGPYLDKFSHPCYPRQRPLSMAGYYGANGQTNPNNRQYSPFMHQQLPMFLGAVPTMRGPPMEYSPTPGHGMPIRGRPTSLADLCHKYSPH